MSTQLIERTFEDIGLSVEHARVYLELIKNGPTPVSVIAKEAKVPRTSCYGLLEDLKKQGLVSSVQGETKQIFIPASPEHLKFLVMQKSLQYQHDLKTLDEKLPELTTLFSSHQSNFPSVQFYEGESGMKTALYDSLSTDEVLAICQGSSEIQSSLKDDPEYLADFIDEFMRRKIKTKELIEETPAGQEYFEKYNSAENQIILIPKRTGKQFGHVDKYIYDNKIAYFSHDTLTAVIIEDQTLAMHEKLLFEDLWKLYTT